MPDQETPDFTKFMVKDEDLETPMITTPQNLGNPSFQQLLRDTKHFLINEQGYDAAAIDSLTSPFSQLPTSIDINQVYRDVAQFVADPEATRVIEETWKLTNELDKEGVTLNPFEWSAMRRMLGKYGAENIEGLAEGRRWWIDLKRQMSNKAADAVAGGATNLTLGLSLLDFVERIDKWTKLQLVPEKQRHEIENAVLPKVVLGGGDRDREFATGTSAALWLIAQNVWGFGEKMSTIVPRQLGRMAKRIGNESLGNFFEEVEEQTMQRVTERKEFVEGQIPPLVAGLGRPLGWLEVAERNLGTQDEFDDMYKMLNDQGVYGQIQMGKLALAGAAMDLFGSPVLVGGGLIARIPAAARAVTKAIPGLTGKVASITSEASRKSFRLEDALDAVAAAERHFSNMDAQVLRRGLENQRVTGKFQIDGDMYRRLQLSKRHVNDEKQFLESFREPTFEEVMMRTPQRSPKLLPAPQSKKPIPVEMHKDRARALERGPDAPVDWSKADKPAFQQRKIFGPDDAEISGDNLNMQIRTGGLAVDDMATLPVAPEYYVTPAAGPIPLIPWRNLDAAGEVLKTERNFVRSLTRGLPEKPGQPVYDLSTSTTRTLMREEDIIRRNLGSMRTIGDKDQIKVYERHLKWNREAQATIRKGIPKDASKFDDVWAPADAPTIMSTPERFNKWLAIAGDRVIRSIYPGALRLGYWDSQMGALHNQMREPQRFFEALDPDVWNQIRANSLRYDQSVNAWSDMVVKAATKAGIVTMRKKFNPAKHWAPYTVDKEKGVEVFNLLDEVNGSVKFNQLWDKATPNGKLMHKQIRRALDQAADFQGIKESDRYLTGYIRHFFTKDQFAGGARPLEYIGLPRNVEVFAAHLLKRGGAEGYERDLMQALEIYGRAMHRKTIKEPMFDFLTAAGERLAKEKNNPAILTYVNDFVSTLQGRPTMTGYALDQWIGGAINSKGGIKTPFLGGSKIPGTNKKIPERIMWNPGDVDRKLMGFTSAIYLGTLTGNPRYPFMQIATAIPTTAMRFGMFRTAKGLMSMATREGQALSKTMGVYKPFFDIFESRSFQKISRMATETVPTITPFGVMTNAGAERAIRGMTGAAALDMYMTKFGFATWDEAVQAGWGRTIMFQSLRASEEVNHMFGAMGRSPFLTRKFGGSQGLSVAATQFLSFIWKQSDELLSNASRGGLEGAGRLMEYFAVSGWLSQIAARDLGIDATTYVGLGYLPQEPDEFTSPAVDWMMNSVEVMAAYSSHDPQRIRRAVNQLLDSTDNLLPLMAGLETTSKGAERLITKELRTSAGEKLRDLDFKTTLPEDIADLKLSDVAQSIRPDETRGTGGELISTVFGQQNINERLFRRGQKAKRKEDLRFYHNSRTAVDDYIRAVEKEDSEAETKLLDELENVYFIRLSSADPIKRAQEARQISWVLRQIDPRLGGDRKLLDRYLKIMQDFGIGIEE